MSPKSSNRITLLLGKELGYCRRVLSGILNHAKAQNLPWILHHAPSDIRALPALERWQPDGVIVYMQDRALIERLLEMEIPTVSVNDTPPELSIPSIHVDNVEVGRSAAEYFLGLGHNSFAYYGSHEATYSLNRETGFCTHLESLGYAVSCRHTEHLPRSPFSNNWKLIDKDDERWLKQLPKPTGILASSDIAAQSLCDACWNLGIQVPEEISILGVDNDVSECVICTPPLSSIEVPAENIGSQAAAYLFDLLEGEKRRHPQIKPLSPLGVITRGSTDSRARCDERIKDILEYIENSVEKEITVSDVCQFSDLSRRSVERLFKSELNSTVLQQIKEARLSKAKSLLLETDISMAEIAKRSGFGNIRRLERTFNQVENASPSAYRSKS